MGTEISRSHRSRRRFLLMLRTTDAMASFVTVTMQHTVERLWLRMVQYTLNGCAPTALIQTRVRERVASGAHVSGLTRMTPGLTELIGDKPIPDAVGQPTELYYADSHT